MPPAAGHLKQNRTTRLHFSCTPITTACSVSENKCFETCETRPQTYSSTANNKQQFGAGVAARTATGIQDFHLHHQIHPASCLTGESKNAWRKAFLLLPPYFFGAFGGSLSVWPLKEEQWEVQSITVSSTAFSMLLICLIFLLFMQICSTRHFLFSNLLQCECLLSWF